MVPNKKPKLIVGLGNPGPEYKYTRHNVGAWFVHALAHKYNAVFKADKKFHGDVAEIVIKGHKVRLLFPTTFMNLSGISVRSVCDYYQIDPEEVLVAHDELDLDVGDVRLKFSGGHGGHNGLRDSAQHIGKNYWRLRIGVGHPGNKKQVSNFLTKNKTPDKEEEMILVGIEKMLKLFEYLMTEGYEKTMLKLHSKELTAEQLKQKEQKARQQKEIREKRKAEKAISQEQNTDTGKVVKTALPKTALQLAMEKAIREEE